MIELLLALMPEILAEAFKNRTLRASHIDGQSIVLQASCHLKVERNLHRGAIALTSSGLYFFEGNELEEIYRFSHSEISEFKKGFLGGFTFIENNTNKKFTCGVEQPKIWLKALKKCNRSIK